MSESVCCVSFGQDAVLNCRYASLIRSQHDTGHRSGAVPLWACAGTGRRKERLLRREVAVEDVAASDDLHTSAALRHKPQPWKVIHPVSCPADQQGLLNVPLIQEAIEKPGKMPSGGMRYDTDIGKNGHNGTIVRLR